MSDHNVVLQQWLARAGGTKGDAASIEHVDEVRNIRWQTRPAPLSEYEDALASSLQAIFGEEVYDLAAVVRRLNERGPKPPSGGVWTEGLFTAEMARLGA
jgi:hypothetical protein